MSQIENWPREDWRSIYDKEVEQEIARKGEADIARWRHAETKCACVYVYEPEAESPYRVELRPQEGDTKVEGRYSTRKQGGDANKEFMRNHTYRGDLEEYLASSQ